MSERIESAERDTDKGIERQPQNVVMIRKGDPRLLKVPLHVFEFPSVLLVSHFFTVNGGMFWFVWTSLRKDSPFSLLESNDNLEVREKCIHVYTSWTEELFLKKKGDTQSDTREDRKTSPHESNREEE